MLSSILKRDMANWTQSHMSRLFFPRFLQQSLKGPCLITDQVYWYIYHSTMVGSVNEKIVIRLSFLYTVTMSAERCNNSIGASEFAMSSPWTSPRGGWVMEWLATHQQQLLASAKSLAMVQLTSTQLPITIAHFTIFISATHANITKLNRQLF